MKKGALLLAITLVAMASLFSGHFQQRASTDRLELKLKKRVLANTVSPLVSQAISVGAAEKSKQIDLALAFEIRNREALEQLLADQVNPNSPNYHKWIAPA